MLGKLPKSIVVDGKKYAIETDYRNVLTAIAAFSDPDLSDNEKAYILLKRLLRDRLSAISKENLEEALLEIKKFLNCGKEDSSSNQKKVMDWEQDENLIFPAINKVAGKEIRFVKYMHWWTFLGYFMEIEEGIFSTVLSIRQKRTRGKKLEKWELDFYRNNKDICELKKRYSKEELEEINRLNELIGE